VAFDVVFIGEAKGIWLRIYIIYPRKGTQSAHNVAFVWIVVVAVVIASAPVREMCVVYREKFSTENSFTPRRVGQKGKYVV